MGCVGVAGGLYRLKQGADAAQLKPHISWARRCQAWLAAGSFPLPREEQVFFPGVALLLSHSHPLAGLFAQVDFALQQEEAQTCEMQGGVVSQPAVTLGAFCQGLSWCLFPFQSPNPSEVPFPV